MVGQSAGHDVEKRSRRVVHDLRCAGCSGRQRAITPLTVLEKKTSVTLGDEHAQGVLRVHQSLAQPQLLRQRRVAPVRAAVPVGGQVEEERSRFSSSVSVPITSRSGWSAEAKCRGSWRTRAGSMAACFAAEDDQLPRRAQDLRVAAVGPRGPQEPRALHRLRDHGAARRHGALPPAIEGPGKLTRLPTPGCPARHLVAMRPPGPFGRGFERIRDLAREGIDRFLAEVQAADLRGNAERQRGRVEVEKDLALRGAAGAHDGQLKARRSNASTTSIHRFGILTSMRHFTASPLRGVDAPRPGRPPLSRRLRSVRQGTRGGGAGPSRATRAKSPRGPPGCG